MDPFLPNRFRSAAFTNFFLIGLVFFEVTSYLFMLSLLCSFLLHSITLFFLILEVLAMLRIYFSTSIALFEVLYCRQLPLIPFLHFNFVATSKCRQLAFISRECMPIFRLFSQMTEMMPFIVMGVGSPVSINDLAFSP